ncbi:MAG: sugar ABC transporter permease [Firmicutes bacterium]|nr:sugar ABC transporter permease [Bacillota bacterium]
MSRFRLSKRRREALTGVFFTLPFAIGFVLFFLYPFLQSIRFSLNHLQIVSGGYVLDYVGLENYRNALLVNADFVPVFVEALGRIITDVPLVVIFSFFAANLLNQEFRGRTAARVIFFLPVILGAGIILQMEQSDYIMTQLRVASTEGGILSGAVLREFLYELRIPEATLDYVTAAVDRIPEIIRASGVQILIFLAGLQSIPRSLYEAADVEGFTAWECFWIITLPMLSPLILTNAIYTIIDSFTVMSNPLVQLVRSTAFGGGGFGLSSAMGVLYFLAISVILLAAGAIISRFVFYEE